MNTLAIDDVRADVALIHGSGLTNTAGMYTLTEASIQNARTGWQLLHGGQVGKIILSGLGPLDIEHPHTEGGLMYNYIGSMISREARLVADLLMNEGVDPASIEVVEQRVLDQVNDGMNTEEGSTSAMDNWAMSAPLIASLFKKSEISVVGVTGLTYTDRMYDIGTYVANRSVRDLKTRLVLGGYVRSEMVSSNRAKLIELPVRRLTRSFLKQAVEEDLSIFDLPDAYALFKSNKGMQRAKRFFNADFARRQQAA